MGMPDRVLKPVRAMYGRLRRRFKMAGGVGLEFTASNGILQGCPLSVIMLNALMSIWARAVEAEVPKAGAAVYADDKCALTQSRASITRVAALTQEFADLSGQVLSVSKCFAFTTVAGGRRSVPVREGRIQWTQQAQIVGASFSFQGSAVSAHVVDAIEQACEVACRISWTPLGFA
eukprot:8407275-Karenia_brevis.AAC.1